MSTPIKLPPGIRQLLLIAQLKNMRSGAAEMNANLAKVSSTSQIVFQTLKETERQVLLTESRLDEEEKTPRALAQLKKECDKAAEETRRAQEATAQVEQKGNRHIAAIKEHKVELETQAEKMKQSAALIDGDPLTALIWSVVMKAFFDMADMAIALAVCNWQARQIETIR